MRRTLALLSLLAFAGCASTTAPERPQAHVVRYLPACGGVFMLSLDGVSLGIYFIPEGSAHRDTVTAGPHAVGYARLNLQTGFPLNADTRILDVRGSTDYSMSCETSVP